MFAYFRNCSLFSQLIVPMVVVGIVGVGAIIASAFARSLTSGELAALLQSCARDQSAAGHRDAALVAVLYGTGIRRGEAVGLDLGDYHPATGELFVRHGKGNKQRVVPIGRTALRCLTSYVQGVRPGLLRQAGENAMFLDDRGQPMPYHTFRRRVRYHARRYQPPVTPHSFRRSCTTELIRGGANLYHVKELLGHESLDTVKHYTRLTIVDLKKTHARCHPRERTPAP